MKTLTWSLQPIAVSDIRDNPKNPRFMTDRDREQLAKGLDRFGIIDKPIINLDRTLIGGHQRKRYLIDKGIDVIECWVPNRQLDEAEAEELNIRLNRNQGRWDKDMLVDAFDLNDLMSWGFEESDFKFPHSVGFDDDKVEENVEIIDEAITKPGDVYDLGRHRLVCGDATDEKAIETALCGVTADLLLTDPPYNVDYSGGTSKHLTIANDALSDSDFHDFLLRAFETAHSVMRAGAAAYVFHAESKGIIFRQAFIQAGFRFSQCLVWVKDNAILGRSDYHWRHEPVLYGWKAGAAHTWMSDHRQTTVLEFDRPTRNDDHPTMKPVSILTYLIRNSTVPDAIVIDSFSGSGSLLIGCELTRRKARLIELDPRYVDATVRRYIDLCRRRNTDPRLYRNGSAMTEDDIAQYRSGNASV